MGLLPDLLFLGLSYLVIAACYWWMYCVLYVLWFIIVCLVFGYGFVWLYGFVVY